MDGVKGIILGVLIPAGFGGAGYGAKYYVDNTYVRSDWLKGYFVQEQMTKKQDEIDELEFIQENERDLTPREKWQLKRLKSQIKELQRGEGG